MAQKKNKKYEVSTLIDTDLQQRFEIAAQKKSTLNDFINDFIHQFLSEQTKRAYVMDLMYFFDFLKRGGQNVGHPKDIGSHHFQIYRDYLIENHYTPATINRKLVAIRSFIKWAMSLKLIDYNPLDAIKLPKVQTIEPTLAFTDEEVLKMFEAPNLSTYKGQMHRMVMIMLFHLGLRRSELAGLKLKDIYQERNHIVLKIYGKGDKYRHLPINQKVYQEIQNYILSYKAAGLELLADDYLIQTENQKKNIKPIDGSTIYRIIEKYAKMCGINRRVSPHSCRATVISHLLDTQKTPIRDVAIFAGHAKITTTERYDKRREALDDSAAYSVEFHTTKKVS
jgi:integrase/recombinase XerD